MRIKKQGRNWWIVEIPWSAEDCGPYQSRKEASEDMERLRQFFLRRDEPGFVTSDESNVAS